MEQQQDTSLFGMNVDQTGKTHLSEAAKWAKFLAIIGFIVCAFVVLAGIFAGSLLSTMMGQYDRGPYSEFGTTSSFSVMLAIYYIVIAVIYFFPCLFLYRFASKMKTALAANDQETLNASFQNLKATFRFLGILTLIGLVFVVLAFVIALLGAAASSGI